GIFSPNTVSVIGNGVLINPVHLVNEIKEIQAHGVSFDNLELSLYAPLILPEHQALDVAGETSGGTKIGTTKRGIGPAYEAVTGRRALFVRDLMDKDAFYKKVKPLNEHYNKLIRICGGEDVAIEDYIDQYMEAGAFLKPFMTNTIDSLNRYSREEKTILFEGAQGVLLDVNFGTYPFVTSSNPTIGGLFTGTGLSHKTVGKVTGICKAYTTRVGEGPFPSELSGSEAEFLREKGREYGATTGRPRRVGWLDLVALKYAVMINGIDEIFFTKLDVLDDFDEIKVVTAYRHKGNESTVFEPCCDYLEQVEPILQSFPGWKKKTENIETYEALPQEAKYYIKAIEELIGIPMGYISVGPGRKQTIKRT
ncbi:MAG: adenylosuccinate synthase, partial [bacterium]|nr:adenylosuccinate synthase [bacterium]